MTRTSPHISRLLVVFALCSLCAAILAPGARAAERDIVAGQAPDTFMAAFPDDQLLPDPFFGLEQFTSEADGPTAPFGFAQQFETGETAPTAFDQLAFAALAPENQAGETEAELLTPGAQVEENIPSATNEASPTFNPQPSATQGAAQDQPAAQAPAHTEKPLPDSMLPSSSLERQVEGPEGAASPPLETLDLSNAQPEADEYAPETNAGLSQGQFYGGAAVILLVSIFGYMLVRALRMNPLGVDPDRCNERMRQFLEETGQIAPRRSR